MTSEAKKLPSAVFTCALKRKSELLPREKVEKMGVVWRGNSSKQSSHELLEAVKMPSDFDWCNKDGKSYCTMSRNQHIPQVWTKSLEVSRMIYEEIE